MTQDEVDLIYDYLHENYRYENGELYLLKDKAFYKKGHKIGVLTIPGEKKGCAHLITAFYIKGITFSMPLSHAIYIFHHKQKPKYILHKDENRMNTNIENLMSCRLQDLQYRTIDRHQGYKKDRDKFRVSLHGTDYEGTIGRFETAEIAKEIYLQAKKLLIEEDLTLQELRNRLSEINPLVKKKSVPKRILPYAHMARNGRFDSKINFKGHHLYFGCFDTPLEAYYAVVNFKEEYEKDPGILQKIINKTRNKTGLKGVYLRGKQIFTQININKKNYTLGPFETEEQAHKEYMRAKKTKVFVPYDSNKLVEVPCVDCSSLVSVKLKNAKTVKYCNLCKKIHAKLCDQNRKTPRKKCRILTREFIQYTLGYFETQEEGERAYEEAVALYDADIHAFKKKFTKTRVKKPRTKEENREMYLLHRNKNGKLTNEQLKNA